MSRFTPGRRTLGRHFIDSCVEPAVGKYYVLLAPESHLIARSCIPFPPHYTSWGIPLVLSCRMYFDVTFHLITFGIFQTLEWLIIYIYVRQGQGVFLFSETSRLALGPTQPPIQWLPVFSLGGESGLVGKFATHSHLIPRLRISGTIPLHPLYAFKERTGTTLSLPLPLRHYFVFYPADTDYKTNTQITNKLKITPIVDKLLEYKRNWIKHVNRMSRNRLPRVMKQYSPTGRRNLGRPLKRLLDTWDQNGSTSGPTPWQICDDDDDCF